MPTENFSFVLSICYFVCGMQTGSRLHYAFIRGDEILRRALYSNIYFDLLVITLSLALPAARLNVWKYLLPLLVGQLFFSLLFKKTVRLAIQHYRARLVQRRGVVVVGPIDDIHPLLMKLAKDKGTGYSLVGYFADTARKKTTLLCRILAVTRISKAISTPMITSSKSFAPSLRPINHAFANWSTIATTTC